MKFKDRVEFTKATLMFKARSSSDVPIYLQTKFKKVSNNHNLRSVENTMLHVPRPKLEFFHKSLDYSGPKIWNEIQLRRSENLKQFKIHYLQWKFPYDWS